MTESEMRWRLFAATLAQLGLLAYCKSQIERLDAVTNKVANSLQELADELYDAEEPYHWQLRNAVGLKENRGQFSWMIEELYPEVPAQMIELIRRKKND